MSVVTFLQQLHDSQLGTALRESLVIFPLVEGIHLIGLALSVGLILITDLRLVGLFLRNVPVADVLEELRPWLLAGFAITFGTGILLIWAEGPKIWEIPVFPFKLILIAFGGLNAVWFELKYGRNVAVWGKDITFPKGVRVAGWLSFVSWSAVVICGRLIPYLDKTIH
jgi:hypothetical protein